LLDAASFRDVVSGRRRGPTATMLRGILRLAEVPYRWAMRQRNRGFETGRRSSHQVNAVVISVGNLTLGGTGKTPMVEWLARWFIERGIRTAIVSRGYKSKPGSLNDEGKELAQKLPAVTHLQNPDRVAAARQVIDQFGCQVIILDDAFQHRRIRRNLDIVLLDALQPFGFDHVFPRGLLREPIEGLSRADVAVLTRADMVDASQRKQIHTVVQHHAPNVTWAECRHAPRSLLSANATEEPPEQVHGKRVAAFCGLGNPVGFRHTLNQCGLNVIGWREFPDHFIYNQHTVNELAHWVESLGADCVVCTHKDLVKLAVNELAGRPLRAVLVGLDFLSGQQALEAKLEPLLAQVPAAK
jgi:tetraacyldisaccharide 4'-kinase